MVENHPAEAEAMDLPPAKPSRWLAFYPAILVLVFTLGSLIFLGVQLYGRDGYSRSGIERVRIQFLQDELGPIFWVVGSLVCLIWILIVFRLVLDSGRAITLIGKGQPASSKLWRLKLVLTASLFAALSLAAGITLVSLSIDLIGR